MNYNGLQARADKLHRGAKNGATTTHKFTFDHYAGIYIVTDADGAEIVRFNTRKITEAKRWLKEWLAN